MDFLSKKIKMPFLQYLNKSIFPFVWGYLRIGLGKSKRAKNFYILPFVRSLSPSKIFLPLSLTFATLSKTQKSQFALCASAPAERQKNKI